MDKIFLKNNHNLDLELSYYKKFSKNDHLFKQYLIKNILLLKQNTFTFSQEEILNLLKLAHGESFDEFLNKFFMKKIYLKYNIRSSDQYSFLGISPILSFSKIGTTYSITLSDTFFNIILEKEDLSKKLQLRTLLSFSNPSVQKIYILLKASKHLVINLDELKELFNIEDSYERFYDLEKKIILPTINEIKNITSFEIDYKKIKKNVAKNSKVTSIELSMINIEASEILLRKIIKYSNNIPLIKKLFYKYSSIYNFEDITLNIEYAIKHYKDDFDSYLIKSIKYNYAKNKFKNKIRDLVKKYKLIININQKYESLEEFRNSLFEEIKRNKIIKLQLNLNLLKFSYINSPNIINNKIYTCFYQELNIDNFCYYEDEQWIILGEFNGNISSNIAILKKY